MLSFKEKHKGKFEVTIRTALMNDVAELLKLNEKWFKPNLESFDNGFLTVVYDVEFFKKAVKNEDILLFENSDGKILGYALVNNVMNTEHIEKVRKQYAAIRPELQTKRIAFSFQILLDTELQGTGFIKTAHKACMRYFKDKYEILVTTAGKDNVRSIRIHTKLGWKNYELNGNYLLGELIL
jgi:RimJ/RimL family protein N-acetyltransferase